MNNTVVLFPLIMEWQPIEDITVYELALCMPYLMTMVNHKVMPYHVDKSLPHFRHFKIIDPNENMKGGEQ